MSDELLTLEWGDELLSVEIEPDNLECIQLGGTGEDGAAGPTADESLKLPTPVSATPQYVRDNLDTDTVLQLSTKAAVVVGSDINTVPWAVNAKIGQQSDIVQIQVDGTDMVTVDKDGSVYARDFISSSFQWGLIAGSQLAIQGQTGNIAFSDSYTYSGTKVLILDMHDDGAAYWAHISTGQGLIADEVMVGGSSGLKLTTEGVYVALRNNADSAYSNLKCNSLISPLMEGTVVQTAGNDITFKVQTRDFTVADNAVEMATGTFTNPSGEAVGAYIGPTMSTTGSATSAALVVDLKGSPAGTTDDNPIQSWRANGAELAKMSSAGSFFVSQLRNLSDYYSLVGNKLQCSEGFSVQWHNNASYWQGSNVLTVDMHDTGSVYYLDISTGAGLRAPAGDATNVALAIGVNGNGFFEQSSNYIGVSVAGSQKWALGASYLRGLVTGSASLSAGGGSIAVPAHSYKGDEDTGWARLAANQQSGGAGGVEVIKLLLDSSSNPITKIMSVLGIVERSSDPDKPADGESIAWMSDGTGLGDDGDLIVSATVGSTTKYSIIFDYSAATTWT
ncbi:hypothetical protein N9X87_00090 [bacterium]|nr:hypothetical protein [bacterium]